MKTEGLKNYRARIIEILELLSSEEEQRKFQAEVDFISVPDELLCKWFDGLSMPESLDSAYSVFQKSEIQAIKEFSNTLDKAGFLIRSPRSISLEDLLERPEWKTMISEAKNLLNALSLSEVKLK